MGSYCLMGTQFQFRMKSPGDDGGCGCTTMLTRVMPPNCALEMVTKVDLMLNEVPHKHSNNIRGACGVESGFLGLNPDQSRH